MEIELREELPGDLEAIREVNQEAFGQPQEARLVDLLRDHDAVLLSLMALVDQRIVGHILYSPAQAGSVEGAALGPMAVRPREQRRGIGSQLVVEGNRRLRELGVTFIVVVGHAEYYPRFGFVAAHRYGLSCRWEVPQDVFILLPLDSTRLPELTGRVHYREEFDIVG